MTLFFLIFLRPSDKLSHCKLLQQLKLYGICGQILSWIKCFLSTRSQTVVIEGEKSFPCEVLFGVPQRTVLGPILFLTFINDIGESLSSNINLFADDCALFREISSEEDSYNLQNDLNVLYDWTKRWKMEFNVSKCYSMTVTLNRNKIRKIIV